MEEVDEPFSWAFEQACGLREVNRETEKKITISSSLQLKNRERIA
jgi:hypothetical protein